MPEQSRLKPERFWAKVDPSGDCWLWTGMRGEQGYGRFTLIANGNRRTIHAHRVAYELLVGPIPDELELDHLCRNLPCVNPDHLEPVTHLENVRRGHPGQKKRPVCQRGHELTSDNIYWSGNSRHCRACARARARARHAALRQNRNAA